MYLRVVFDTFAVRFTFISSINVYLAVCDVFLHFKSIFETFIYSSG